MKFLRSKCRVFLSAFAYAAVNLFPSVSMAAQDAPNQTHWALADQDQPSQTVVIEAQPQALQNTTKTNTVSSTEQLPVQPAEPRLSQTVNKHTHHHPRYSKKYHYSHNRKRIKSHKNKPSYTQSVHPMRASSLVMQAPSVSPPPKFILLDLPKETISRNQKWIVFGGLGYFNYPTGSNNQQFSVTNTETDQLAQSTQTNKISYTAGFATDLEVQSNVLSHVSMGLTLRYDPTTFEGQVYQYQEPTQQNYTYRYQVRPVTELFESDIFFEEISKLHTEPFLVLGAGMTEANLNFEETPQSSDAVNPISASGWRVRPDLAVGAGVNWRFKRHYFVRTEYLYQYRGNTTVQNIPINLNEHGANILLGYTFN